MSKLSLFVDRSCLLSDCGRYRYCLDIIWDRAKPLGVFCGLNPSKATAEEDDNTSGRMTGFATSFGWGGFRIINLFAFIATDPAQMFAAADPIGPENDLRQLLIGFDGPRVACWGNKGGYRQRSRDVALLVPDWLCFGHNADGSPKHPLYLKASMQLVAYCSGVVPLGGGNTFGETHPDPVRSGSGSPKLPGPAST